jgi:hypothetical protein
MYTVPEQLKKMYKNDFLPAVPKNYEKYMLMYFPELDFTIDTRTRGRVDIDSFSLEENLCSNTDLTLGSCEAAIFKIKINGIVHDLTGRKVIVTQYVIGDDGTTYEMPFGTFYALKAGKQSDMGFKELTCMDPMIKTDVDVSAWYNALTWPQTIKSMRESLLTYMGLEYEEQAITNDAETIDKTINPTSLIGRDVLRRLTELNGGFGHFTRNGKFKVIQLSGLGLYPSEDLYPAEDLFPSESGEYIAAGYEKIDYEEYIVEQITSVTVREDDEDIGATAGVPGNPYIISGNFLLFSKSGVTLQRIVNNLYLQVKNKFYRPHNTTMIGLPYMEVGDSVTIITSDDAIESFIFKRTLTGINAMNDVISASGNQYRDQKVTQPTEIQQLKSKTLKIQKSVDGLQIDLADTAEGLQNQINITAGQLQTQITDTEDNLQTQIIQTTTDITQQVTDVNNNLQGQINVQAGQINLKVDSAGVIAAINLSGSGTRIEGAKIDLVSNAVSIVGKLYLNLNDNDTAVYAVSSGGTSNVVSYKVAPNPYGGATFQAVVFGDMSEKTVVNGDTIGLTARSVSLNAGSGGNVQLSSTRSSSSNLFYSVNWDGQYFYPNTSDCYVGGPSFYWNGLYFRGLYHYSSGTLGFFGASQHSKTSVSTMSTSGTLADAINKINELRNALNGYGLM